MCFCILQGSIPLSQKKFHRYIIRSGTRVLEAKVCGEYCNSATFSCFCMWWRDTALCSLSSSTWGHALHSTVFDTELKVFMLGLGWLILGIQETLERCRRELERLALRLSVAHQSTYRYAAGGLVVSAPKLVAARYIALHKCVAHWASCGVV